MFQMMTEFATSPVDNSTYEVTAPASPTAALYEDVAPTLKPSRVKTSKRVSFSEDVKTHDGLTTRSAIFDRLVTMYFVDQQEVSELDVLRIAGNDVDAIRHLHEDLLDMSLRIQNAVEEGKQCAPVLPRGGGLCTKLCPPHVAYIQVLDRVVEAAGNRVAKALALAVSTDKQVSGDDVVML